MSHANQSSNALKFGADLLVLFVGFSIAALVSLYLLWATIDGANLIKQIEAQTGKPLTCVDAYDSRAINDYFYPHRRIQGDVLYVIGGCMPIWLLLPFILSICLAVTIRDRGLAKRFAWLPFLGVGMIGVVLMLYLPMIRLINCATD